MHQSITKRRLPIIFSTPAHHPIAPFAKPSAHFEFRILPENRFKITILNLPRKKIPLILFSVGRTINHVQKLSGK